MLKNTTNRFGNIAIVLHWLIALAVFGEFGLGLYMTNMDYYHSYYQTMPGDSITVFNLFEFPAIIHGLPNQEDWSIFWHYWLSWAMMALAFLHTMGALKHHFLDRDETLRRMLGLSARQS